MTSGLLQIARVLVLADGYPVSPGHTLIVPKRHVQSVFELTEAELVAVSNALYRRRLR